MNLVSCSRDLTDHVWNERSLTIALFSLSDKTETFNSPSDTKKPLLTTVLTNYLHTHISKVKNCVCIILWDNGFFKSKI